MTDKTKRKIEAMAENKFDLEMVELITTLIRTSHEEGAAAWAEWCERFERALEIENKCELRILKGENGLEYQQITPDGKVAAGGTLSPMSTGGATVHSLELLKEYRQWLEHVDG